MRGRPPGSGFGSRRGCGRLHSAQTTATPRRGVYPSVHEVALGVYVSLSCVAHARACHILCVFAVSRRPDRSPSRAGTVPRLPSRGRPAPAARRRGYNVTAGGMTLRRKTTISTSTRGRASGERTNGMGTNRIVDRIRAAERRRDAPGDPRPRRPENGYILMMGRRSPAYVQDSLTRHQPESVGTSTPPRAHGVAAASKMPVTPAAHAQRNVMNASRRAAARALPRLLRDARRCYSWSSSPHDGHHHTLHTKGALRRGALQHPTKEAAKTAPSSLPAHSIQPPPSCFPA